MESVERSACWGIVELFGPSQKAKHREANDEAKVKANQHIAVAKPNGAHQIAVALLKLQIGRVLGFTQPHDH